MLGLNRNQWLNVAVIIVGALLVSKDQLETLVNVVIAGKIIAACGILNLILGGLGTMITGQTGMAAQLQNLRGVKLNVDKTADPALARLAVDPRYDNIAPEPGQEAAVAKVAAQQ